METQVMPIVEILVPPLESSTLEPHQHSRQVFRREASIVGAFGPTLFFLFHLHRLP